MPRCYLKPDPYFLSAVEIQFAGYLFSKDTGPERGVGEIHCLIPQNSLQKVKTPVVWRA